MLRKVNTYMATHKENELIFEAYKSIDEKKKKKKKLEDLSGDGKITRKDVLIARGVKMEK